MGGGGGGGGVGSVFFELNKKHINFLLSLFFLSAADSLGTPAGL